MIKIKPARIKDLGIVRQLAHEIWPAAYLEILGPDQLSYMLLKIYSLPSLEHQLTILKHRFIILNDNKTPVGFASFSRHDNDKTIYHLNKIYVIQNQLGKNLGKQLLNYIISEIKKSGASSLQLNVNRYNKALNFYKKQGFKIIREEDIDIGEGYYMNDYVLELKF